MMTRLISNFRNPMASTVYLRFETVETVAEYSVS